MRESRLCKGYDQDLFRKVKETVSMQQAVEYCGLQAGRKGLCLCPFHDDRHPSMKIYPDGKGYYCFTCGSGGDQINFLAQFREISNYEAAKELAEAFGVPLQEPATYRERREAELARRKRAEAATFAKRAKMYLTVYYSLLCEAIRERNRHFYEGLQNLSWTQYILEQLETCPDQVYADRKAVRKIGEIEGRIGGWYFGTEGDGSVSGRDLLSDFRD